jgi:transposase InsO family protein
MRVHYPQAGLSRLCRLFGRTRQAFYDHSHRKDDKEFEQAIVIDRVRVLRSAGMPGIGGLKLHKILKEELLAHKVRIGRDRFFDLLRMEGLLIKRKKKYACTTNSDHPYRKYPDLIKELAISAPCQVWVSDITYLRTRNGFIYLFLITDAYSRKIVGHHLSHNLKAQGCLYALNKALQTLDKQSAKRLIHHSDRGIQYCCHAYTSVLKQHNIQISMTQSGSPYDNAIAERINGILKSEGGLDMTFRSYHHAVGPTHQAIDVYNRLRPHMSLGYLTPEKVHSGQKPLKKAWKKKESTAYKPY